MGFWLVPLAIITTFVQFSVAKESACSENGLTWLMSKNSKHSVVYSMALLMSLSCTAFLRLIFFKQWKRETHFKALKRLALGDVFEHVRSKNSFESDDSQNENGEANIVPQDTEQALVKESARGKDSVEYQDPGSRQTGRPEISQLDNEFGTQPNAETIPF